MARKFDVKEYRERVFGGKEAIHREEDRGRYEKDLERQVEAFGRETKFGKDWEIFALQNWADVSEALRVLDDARASFDDKVKSQRALGSYTTNYMDAKSWDDLDFDEVLKFFHKGDGTDIVSDIHSYAFVSAKAGEYKELISRYVNFLIGDLKRIESMYKAALRDSIRELERTTGLKKEDLQRAVKHEREDKKVDKERDSGAIIAQYIRQTVPLIPLEKRLKQHERTYQYIDELSALDVAEREVNEGRKLSGDLKSRIFELAKNIVSESKAAAIVFLIEKGAERVYKILRRKVHENLYDLFGENPRKVARFIEDNIAENVDAYASLLQVYRQIRSQRN